MDDHTDLDKANRERAQEEAAYRDEVSRGEHGAHKPCETFPIEEAQERGIAGDMDANRVHKTDERGDALG